MIISSWNVNSVRARIENIKEYLKKFSPDIMMMQEIKTPDETYPYDDIKTLKYENYVFGQKSYNGVAIVSKKKLNSIQNDIFKDKNKQSRVISAEIKHKKKNITCNLGSGKGTTVLELITNFQSITGEKINFKIVGEREGDSGNSFACIKKSMKELKWKPKMTLSDISNSSYKWFLNKQRTL